jgi:hypothetical protein
MADEISAPVAESAPVESAGPKKIQFTVKDQSIELDPVADYERLKDLAQRGMSSDEKFQEASSMSKLASEVLEGLKDPKQLVKAYEKAGLSKAEARKVVEDWLREEYEEEDMPPEAKAKRDVERELEELRAEKRKREEESANERKASESLKIQREIEDELIAAFETSKLPRTPVFGKMILDHMERGLSAKDATKLVEEEYSGNVKNDLSNKDVAELKSLLGEKAVNALIKDNLEQIKTKEAPFKGNSASSVQPPKIESPDKKELPKVIDRDSFYKKINFF